MAERLTKRNSDGSVGINDLRYYNYDDFQKMAKKLAHYEDLEEQGRLLVLPEGLDTNKFISFIAYDFCVSLFGLKAICENKNASHKDCKECWEKALKGE